MSFSADLFLKQSLDKREAQNALRKLIVNNHKVDFCSNDYLGFAQSVELKIAIENEYRSIIQYTNGSGGSRLLSGNSAYAEELEKSIALFHAAEAGLIYNSGYDANVGLFSAIGQKGSTIIYDELIHASVHDGIKLSSATTFMFKHNDLIHLEERLKIAEGIVYVAVESIYSMDGDDAPLKEITVLCEKYNANLIVDEAHATGITINKGKGRVQQFALEQKVFARVHTFGKALGCHGAIVLGNNLLRNYLINYSRSFIYTTALPLHSLMAIHQAYQLLEKSDTKIEELHQLVSYFKNKLASNNAVRFIESDSPIQCVLISGNSNVKNIAEALQLKGLDIRPILSPTVPKDKERLRICLHAYNTNQEIDAFFNVLLSNLPTIES
ncbi:MAG: pyridoxal phosphate-dependent aminotransferase family protein [Bacteroidia bacterium]|nr:pyridoxal phosphate-dependent aminotransferase family protein [Bacteroidia bacterium]